jgi:hypothetical protein
MSHIRIFINEEPLTVPAGASVRDAVEQHDDGLLGALDDGSVFVTDGRGIDLAPESVLHGGSILRVVVSRRRSARDHHADA